MKTPEIILQLTLAASTLLTACWQPLKVEIKQVPAPTSQSQRRGKINFIIPDQKSPTIGCEEITIPEKFFISNQSGYHDDLTIPNTNIRRRWDIFANLSTHELLATYIIGFTNESTPRNVVDGTTPNVDFEYPIDLIVCWNNFAIEKIGVNRKPYLDNTKYN